MSTQSLVDEFQATWAQMKAALDEGRRANDVKIQQLNQRLDQLETQQKRPLLPGMGGYNPTTPPDPDARLFFKAIAAGGPANLRDAGERERAVRLFDRIEAKARVGPSEGKALSLGDDTTGGFLALPDFVAEVQKGVVLSSPIRQIARVRPTSFRSVQVPVRSGTFSASWIGETATRTETTGLTYSLEDVPVYEMYAEVVVSLQDLEDSSLDLQAEIAAEAAEQFAVLEGAAFVKGDSVRKPEGFMTNAAIAHTASGDANLLKADGLIDLMYSLKEAYSRNAYFVLNRKTIGAIRKLKNSYDEYLWQPALSEGAPNRILGIPYIEASDMDDVGAGKFPVALGDFRRGYWVVDRTDLAVQRLNEKYAEQGQVAFLIRRRVGGQVVIPESIVKLEIAAS